MSKAKIYGMIHLDALPGTPKHSRSISDICAKALSEAAIYHANGLHGIIIENMHDVPYLNRSVGPEITTVMTVVALELRKLYPNWTIGIQVLAGANREALAIAHACSLDFIRAEGFVFGHIADEGLMNADAADLLRFRKLIGAEDVLVYCDIKKKHAAHAITNDLGIGDIAKAAAFFLADGLIVTGTSTGEKAAIEDLQTLRSIDTGLPIFVGSGVDTRNLEDYIFLADALIVGSSFKEDGYWTKPLDSNRIGGFMERFNEL
jgi:uncharacterized protein